MLPDKTGLIFFTRV